MRVSGVIPGSMAEAAEIAVGDVVKSLCGLRLDSLDALGHAARLAGANAIAKAVVIHERALSERTMVVQRKPLETGVEYGVLERDVRLRTLTTRPRAARASVLFVQGFSRESIDFATANVSPIRELVHGWTREGFATMRMEKRGVGDSEGDAPDFRTDLDDFRAALESMARPVFVFGHSLGGMMAPLLSDGVAGLVVYGTSPLRWYECLRRSRDRQRALRKMSAVDGPVPRTAYEDEIDAVDLAAAWKKVTCPVLVLHGEFDWVVGEDEARAIGPTKILSGLDHWITRHTNVQESLDNAGGGAIDRAVLDATTAWMNGVLSR